MYLDILFFAVLAVFLIYRLFETLGTKTDDDVSKKYKKPSFLKPQPLGKDNVKNRHYDIKDSRSQNVTYLEAEISSNDLEKIKKYDPAFSVESFIKGALQAFEIIVSAFAKGNADILKPLLHKDIYDDFEQEILERKAKGETLETKILQMKAIKISKIQKEKHLLLIQIQFDTIQTNIIKDSHDKVIAGDDNEGEEFQDLWLFGRNPNAKNPTWLLIETDRL